MCVTITTRVHGTLWRGTAFTLIYVCYSFIGCVYCYRRSCHLSIRSLAFISTIECFYHTICLSFQCEFFSFHFLHWLGTNLTTTIEIKLERNSLTEQYTQLTSERNLFHLCNEWNVSENLHAPLHVLNRPHRTKCPLYSFSISIVSLLVMFVVVCFSLLRRNCNDPSGMMWKRKTYWIDMINERINESPQRIPCVHSQE